MNRVEYPSGMWSERDGRKLVWGRGDKRDQRVWSAHEPITYDLTPGECQAIRKAGYSPEDFCRAGGNLVAHVLVPEIEACIAHARAEADQAKQAERDRLAADIASGEAMRVAEMTEQHGAELQYARRLRGEERDRYVQSYRDYGLVSYSGDSPVGVDAVAIRSVVGERAPDGAFPGCTNQAWIITAEEWDQIIDISKDIQRRREEAIRINREAEAEDIQRKIEHGYCFSCGSYCHGDCGHYSSDPAVQMRLDLRQMRAEADYGIAD